MYILRIHVDIVQESPLEPVVAALRGILFTRVVFVDREYFDVGEGNLSVTELPGKHLVKGYRSHSGGETELERARYS